FSVSYLQGKLTAMSGTRGENSEICIKHLAGLDLERDFPEDTDIKRCCLMFNAYATLLKSKRKSLELVLPENMRSLGIYYRLTGLEYYLHAIANYNQSYMDDIHKESTAEKDRQRTDITKRKFSIPNIKLGAGFSG